MGKCQPIEIDGVLYPSQRAAARALGVNETTLSHARMRGTEDKIGTGRCAYQKPITIRGVTYPSRGVAAERLGISRAALSQAIKRGTVDNVGLGPRPRATCKRPIAAAPPPAQAEPDPAPEITEGPAMPPHPFWTAERDVLLLRLASGAKGAIDYAGLAVAAERLGKSLCYCQGRFHRLVSS